MRSDVKYGLRTASVGEHGGTNAEEIVVSEIKIEIKIKIGGETTPFPIKSGYAPTCRGGDSNRREFLICSD